VASPSTIRSILGAISRDPCKLALIRQEHDELATAIATNDSYGREIINGSGNGQSYSVAVTMNKLQRLRLLEQVLHCYDNSVSPTSWAPIVLS